MRAEVMEFVEGDRIQDTFRKTPKTGFFLYYTVDRSWCYVKWDGGKRKVHIHVKYLQRCQ